ncbi:MAG: plastocyanin/azurin family copper-binding protein [Verrucomicrobiota bacterium]
MKKFLIALTALCLTAHSSFSEDETFEITITADKLQFLYDIKEFTVKAGQKVKLTLVNPEGSIQPHNLLIVNPGKMHEVGAATLQLMSNPDFLKDPVPDSEDVLFKTKLLQAGQEEVLEFTAPEEPGDYQYLCTYPGHYAVMNGVMKVE